MEQKISKIAIGSAQFGLHYGLTNTFGVTPAKEVLNILTFAKKSGIKVIDTAILYGESETVLGQCDVSDFEVITKISFQKIQKSDIRKYLYDSLIGSINRLKVNKLGGVLFHNSKDLLGKDGEFIFENLSNLKKDGMLEKIGISAYETPDVEEVINRFDIDIVQAPLNIFDRRFEESGLIQKCQTKKIEFHARSIFLQGLLINPRIQNPYFGKWKNLLTEFNNILIDNDIDPIQACLSYPLSISGVSKIIIGIESLTHLEQIINIPSKEIDMVLFNNFSTNDKELINPTYWK